VQGIASLRSTTRGDALYLHVVTAVCAGTYRFPAFGCDLRDARLLGDRSEDIDLCRDGDEWVLRLPARCARSLPVVVRATMV
jgi:hypothetical protein